MRSSAVVLIVVSFLLHLPVASGQWVHPGPFGGSVSSFAASGSNLYVGTRSEGVYRSVDSGLTWQSISAALPDSSVRAVGVVGSVVLAATDSATIFRTSDGGLHWSLAIKGLPQKDRVQNFFTLGSMVFAATDSGLYRSTDGGSSWTAANTGLPRFTITSFVSGGAQIYCSDRFYRIFRSNDSGRMWVDVSKGVGGGFLATIDTVILAVNNKGIYRSSDRGRDWIGPDTTGLGGPSLLVFGLLHIDISLTLQTATGLLRSTDTGRSWAPITTNGSIAALPLTPLGSVLFTKDSLGILRSSDGGVTWHRSNAGLHIFDIGYKITSPVVSMGNTVIARGDSLYSSTDLGVHWSYYRALNLHQIRDFVHLGRLTFAATDSDGILRTSDDGNTWMPLDGMTNVYPVTSLATGAGVLYAATGRGGIYGSTDSGATWLQIKTDAGLQGGTPEAFVAASGRYVFSLFGDEQGITIHHISRSTDSGKTWTALLEPAEYVWITHLWANSHFLFVGDYLVYRTALDSSNWNWLEHPQNRQSLLVTDSEMFLGYPAGIFISKDNGDHWDSAGLSSQTVSSLLIADGYLFAGTEAGLWRRALSDFPATPRASVTPVNTGDLTLSPNPARGIITISTQEPIASVTILNALGQTVLNVQHPSLSLELSSLPPGTYFARIETNNGSVMRTIIKQ